TTFSPPACSSATWAQTLSSTSVRSSPVSPATIEEPNLATTVMAPSSRVEFELEVADDHLVPGLEPGPLEGGDDTDLAQAALQVVERLVVREVVPRDQQLDAAAGDPEAAIALGGDVEALRLAGPVDAVLGLEPSRRRGRPGVLGQGREDRA